MKKRPESMNFTSMDLGLSVCSIGSFPHSERYPPGVCRTFLPTAACFSLYASGFGIDMRRIDVSAAGRYGQFVEPAA